MVLNKFYEFNIKCFLTFLKKFKFKSFNININIFFNYNIIIIIYINNFLLISLN